MRKWIALLVVAVLLLTGCWSRIEVSDLGVVAGLAVDTGEQMPVRMTLYISRSPGAGPFERGQAQWVVAREGRNVADAISQVRRASARRISLHHLRMVLVSEEYARKGMDELLDLLSRHPQVRLLTRLMIVRGRAQSILEVQPTLEALQPENLAEIVSAKGGPDPRLKELLVGRAAESFSPWVYALHTVERPARMENAPEKAVELAGAALLRQGRVVAMLDQRMTQALLWLEGNPREVTLIAPCPDDGVRSLSAQVQRGEVAVYPSAVRGSLRIHVAVTGTVDLIHSECKEDVVKPEDRAKLEHQLQVTLQERLKRLIEILQETETDPAALGKWVQLRQTAFWRTIPQDGWPKVWKTTPVSLDVGIILARAGLLIEPADRTRAELEKERK